MDHNKKSHDWNEGHPDHEGVMAVTQLYRIAKMSKMLLNIIGENDDLPGWIQYKLSRAYNDMSDLFGYIDAKSHADIDKNYCNDQVNVNNFSEVELKETKLHSDSLSDMEVCSLNESLLKSKNKKYPTTVNAESNIRNLLRLMIRQRLEE